jgi:hypothetical protein
MLLGRGRHKLWWLKQLLLVLSLELDAKRVKIEPM